MAPAPTDSAENLGVKPTTVNGAGTLTAPAGSLSFAPAAAGEGRFDLDVELPAGAIVPTGQATFTLHFGALRYEIYSSQLHRLAATRGEARIEGLCTINGVSGFEFIVTVSEGHAAVGRGETKLRLQVRDTGTETVVLDTQPGSNAK